MENFYIHDAIRNLYSNVVTIKGKECFDENNNHIEINMDLVKIEAERLSNIKPINLQELIEQQQNLIQELSAKVTALENKTNQ